MTRRDIAAATLATLTVTAYALAAFGWLVVFPTVGLLWSFGVLP